MSINVTLHAESMRGALAGLAAVFNRGKVLKLIGGAAQEAVLMRFKNSKALFAANAPSTVRRKQGDIPLRDTGTLMNSISFRAELTSVTVGTPIEYAASAHDGDARKKQPAREFLAPGPDIDKSINAAIERHITGALR